MACGKMPQLKNFKKPNGRPDRRSYKRALRAWKDCKKQAAKYEAREVKFEGKYDPASVAARSAASAQWADMIGTTTGGAADAATAYFSGGLSALGASAQNAQAVEDADAANRAAGAAGLGGMDTNTVLLIGAVVLVALVALK